MQPGGAVSAGVGDTGGWTKSCTACRCMWPKSHPQQPPAAAPQPTVPPPACSPPQSRPAAACWPPPSRPHLSGGSASSAMCASAGAARSVDGRGRAGQRACGVLALCPQAACLPGAAAQAETLLHLLPPLTPLQRTSCRSVCAGTTSGSSGIPSVMSCGQVDAGSSACGVRCMRSRQGRHEELAGRGSH